MMKILNLVAAILFIGVANADCSSLWEQCGGKGFTGSTCCVQPKKTPDVLSLPKESVKCTKYSPDFSQCVPLCPRDKPCLSKGRSTCVASINGASDGRGRQYCGVATECTNPEYCFSNNFACVCGGSTPCALTRRPGGCVRTGSNGTCPAGSKRCPAFKDDQCGGKFHKEPKSCQPGLTCVKRNTNYSQCIANV